MLRTYVLRTDSSCFIDGQVYEGIPLLVTDTEILQPQSDYLRQLAVLRRLSKNSVNEVCKHLRTHLHLMYEDGLGWEQTNEKTLRKWRNSMAGANPSNSRKRYLNNVLHSIFNFLIWAESNDLVKGVIGPINSFDKNNYLVPIEVLRWNNDGTPAGFNFPLLFKTVGQSVRRNASADQVNGLFVELSDENNKFLAERNTLIARFAEKALMRRNEIANLTIEQLPSAEEAYFALKRNEEIIIRLKITKGMKLRDVLVDPQLIVDTWSHIQGSRNDLLLSKGIKPDSNGVVFLSWRTARKIHPDSLTNIFSHKQKKANINNSGIHSLRSIGATARVENLIDMYEFSGLPIPDLETLLLQLREVMGHNSTETTKNI